MFVYSYFLYLLIYLLNSNFNDFNYIKGRELYVKNCYKSSSKIANKALIVYLRNLSTISF